MEHCLIGCITCKAKRLKCDETKPSCQQCHKRSVTCGGYKKDFKWRPFEETTFNKVAPPRPKRSMEHKHKHGIWDCTDGLQIQSHQTKLRILLQQQVPSPIPQLQLQVPKSKLKMSQCKSPSSMRRRRPLHPFPPRIMASQTYSSVTLLYSI